MRELLLVCLTSLVLGQASHLLSPGEFKKRLKSDKKLEPRAWESECRITELAQAHNPDVNVTCDAVHSSYYRQALYCKDKNGKTIASLGSNSDEELLKWVVSSECNGRNGAICLNLLDVQDRDSHILVRVCDNFLSLDSLPNDPPKREGYSHFSV